jgi:nicotinamidase-related amidase
MPHNINELRVDNTVLALVDHQPFVLFPVESHGRAELISNVTALAGAAKTLGVETVLTTINAKGGPLADPLFTQVSALFPDVEPVDRSNTNAWADPAFVDAVRATDKPNLVIAGLWTEVCVQQTALSAVKDGYRVYVVSDASGGMTREAHEDAKARLALAGVPSVTWMALVAEWAPDNTSAEYQSLYPVLSEHGGPLAMNVQYVMAQLQAGTVNVPAQAAG